MFPANDVEVTHAWPGERPFEWGWDTCVAVGTFLMEKCLAVDQQVWQPVRNTLAVGRDEAQGAWHSVREGLAWVGAWAFLTVEETCGSYLGGGDRLLSLLALATALCVLALAARGVQRWWARQGGAGAIAGTAAGAAAEGSLTLQERAAVPEYSIQDEEPEAQAQKSSQAQHEEARKKHEDILGKRQAALLRLLRKAEVRRRAAQAKGMLALYEQCWALLREIYSVEQDHDRPTAVRETTLRVLWPTYDAHWHILKTWATGLVVHETTPPPTEEEERTRCRALYKRLARGMERAWQCPRWAAAKNRANHQWEECVALAELRDLVRVRYWRECGPAYQTRLLEGIWTALMGSEKIRLSLPPHLRDWTPIDRPCLSLSPEEPFRFPQPAADLVAPGPSPSVLVRPSMELVPRSCAPRAEAERQEALLPMFSLCVPLFRANILPDAKGLGPSPRPSLLEAFLDAASRGKMATVALGALRFAEQRQMLDLEPGLETEMRRGRARARALVPTYLSAQDMAALAAVVERGAAEHVIRKTSKGAEALLWHPAMRVAMARERAVRRQRKAQTEEAGVLAKAATQGETSSTTWPNLMEVRLDLFAPPPPEEALGLCMVLKRKLAQQRKEAAKKVPSAIAPAPVQKPGRPSASPPPSSSKGSGWGWRSGKKETMTAAVAALPPTPPPAPVVPAPAHATLAPRALPSRPAPPLPRRWRWRWLRHRLWQVVTFALVLGAIMVCVDYVAMYGEGLYGETPFEEPELTFEERLSLELSQHLPADLGVHVTHGNGWIGADE